MGAQKIQSLAGLFLENGRVVGVEGGAGEGRLGATRIKHSVSGRAASCPPFVKLARVWCVLCRSRS